MNLFTYGTLMFPEVWRRVVPREFASQAATVAGYRVRRAAGELFPVMLPADADDRVPGVTYFGVDAEAIALLDAYESTLYDRLAVEAVLDDGRTVMCQAYVLPTERAQFASDEPWTAAWFREQALDAYLRQW